MSEYVCVSNTGKTITVSLSRDFYDRWAEYVPLDAKGRPHVDLDYDAGNRAIRIVPGTTGRRVGQHTNGNGGAYVGCASKVFPEWPAHGRLTFHPILRGDGAMDLILPDVLPAPEPRKTSTSKAHNSRTDFSHAGPIKERTFPPMPLQKPGLSDRAATEKTLPYWVTGPLPPAEQVLTPAPEMIAAATRNVLIELEGQSFTFNAPLRLRLKILSLLQSDPAVKGDAPIGFD